VSVRALSRGLRHSRPLQEWSATRLRRYGFTCPAAVIVGR